MQTTICDKCGRELVPGDFPFCPHGGKGDVSFNVKGDEYPGGIWIENLGPKPVKVYSETERQMIMKRRGLKEFVRHMPVPGSDKSPHTVSWDVGPIGDPRPICMLSPEEQKERRKVEAERLGLTVEELEAISGPVGQVVRSSADDDAIDGGEFAQRTIQNRFSLAADRDDTRQILEILNGSK